MKRVLLTILFLCSISINATESRWWKGNLHTHSFWSDGDDFPEMITGWYKDNGYQFLAITDHNISHDTEKWMVVEEKRNRDIAYEKYLKRWGADWVESKTEGGGKTSVRLKKLSEYRPKFERPGKFLLIQAEEITSRYLTSPIHLNASNLRYRIAPQTGDNVVDTLQKNIDAVLAQEKETGQPMLPHINHPNFGWAITAEELMQVRGEQFFEVYNGHPYVRNRGDKTHAGLERVWDIVNTRRLTELKLPLMYGLATDDSHAYHKTGSKLSNTGRGWVMVRASDLTPASLINAMKRGDFYSTTGVELASLEQNAKQISLVVKARAGVNYTIQFIGTRKGFDSYHTPIRNAAGEKLRLTHRYSDDVGAVLKEVLGPKASYKFKGDELYVRAKVVSSVRQKNPIVEGDWEVAWTQPIRPGK
ncbi:MAG: histidinol-phosphatase [Verrucomicrobiales bacterium]|nr:histidinol-phosphatase [Verrucomicrobiales bacterium]